MNYSNEYLPSHMDHRQVDKRNLWTGLKRIHHDVMVKHMNQDQFLEKFS